MTAKEMRDELRALRKEHVKPVSKMRVADISAEIQRLKVAREETPAVRAVPSKAPLGKKTVETLVEAKAEMAPVAGGTKKGMPRKTARKAYEPEPKAEAPPAPKGRPAKGSEEAKARMAAIRQNKGKKAE